MRRQSPERAIQVSLANHLDRFASPGAIWWAVPNGGHRHILTAVKLKAEGVRRGVPDLCFVLDGGRAAFLELKAGKGRLSDAQVGFGARAQRLGAHWAVARSLEEAIAILADWGVCRGLVA